MKTNKQGRNVLREAADSDRGWIEVSPLNLRNLLDDIETLESENAGMREVVKFYAESPHRYGHPENAVDDYHWDNGKKAREALGKGGE